MGRRCLMEAIRQSSRHPLHGRNDMKTSKRGLSRQKHAHKQRKQGLSCHHVPPSCIRMLQPLQPILQSGLVSWMRDAQVRPGTLRHAQEPSETLCFNLDSTVHKSLNRHNRHKRHDCPKRPKSPNSPKTGCSLSILVSQFPQLSVKNP